MEWRFQDRSNELCESETKLNFISAKQMETNVWRNNVTD